MYRTSTASTQASWVASVLSSAFSSSAREPLAWTTGRCCPVTRDPILSAIATGADHFHRPSQSSPVFRAALGEGGRGAGAPLDRTPACAPHTGRCSHDSSREEDSGLSGTHISHRHCQLSRLPSTGVVVFTSARRTGGLFVGASQANNLCFFSGFASGLSVRQPPQASSCPCSKAGSCSTPGGAFRRHCSHQRGAAMDTVGEVPLGLNVLSDAQTLGPFL